MFPEPSAAASLLRHGKVFLTTIVVAASALAASEACAQVSLVSTEINVMNSGLASPTAVATDGQGDLFLVDSLNNRVVMVPASGQSAGTPVTLISGLSTPNGVAADWSGDVYIADTGNNRIVMLPLTSGSYGTPVAITPGLNAPMSVAVDGAGNLYVADTGNNRGVMLPLVAGAYASMITVASGLNNPQGIAIDGRKNLFFADTGNNRIVEFPCNYGAYGPSVVVRAMTAPTGLYVDQSYNLFIADTVNNRVLEQPWQVGARRYNAPVVLTVDLSSPAGVTEDSNGNVYVADTLNNRVVRIVTQNVSFSASEVSVPGSQQTYNFEIGAGTTVGSIEILTQGIPAMDFNDAGTSTCTPQTYASTTLCGVSVSFTPLNSGLRKGAVDFYDDLGNPLVTAFISGTGLAPQAIFIPGTQTTVGSGLSAPAGVAIDGSGDIFIADTGNNRIVEVPLSGGVYGAQQVVAVNNVVWPLGMAFDGNGSLYIASNENDSVVKLPSNNGLAGQQSRVGTALYGPWAVATDKAGVVYIADTLANNVDGVPWSGAGYGQQYDIGNYHRYPESIAADALGNVFFASPYLNYVVEVPWQSGGFQTQVNLPLTGLVAPAAIVSDADSNLFILDSGKGSITMLPRTGSGYGNQLLVANGFNSPSALAIDSNENLYVADTGNNQVVMVSLSAPPSLGFANTYIGSTSSDSAQTVSIVNVGNQPLNITSLSYPPDFPETAGAATPCFQGIAVAGGTACELSISFTPQMVGTPLAEAVLFTTNTLNPQATAQTLPVSGTSLQQATQTISCAPEVDVTYGASPVVLNAVASSGLPVTYTVLSGPGTLNARANTVTIVGAGAIVIQAAQAGNGAYTAATSVTQSIVVTPAVLTVTPANSSAVYGAVNSVFGYSVTGFVNGERPWQVLSGSAVVTAGATSLSNAGTYPITASAGTLFASNYSLAFVPGTLTVNPAMLTVQPAPATVPYGQALPAFSVMITGFVNTDTMQTAVTGAPQFTVPAGFGSSPGTYAVIAAQGSLSAVNYAFRFHAGQLTIVKRPLTITPNPVTMTYGSALPAISYVVSGFVNGDSVGVVSGTPAFHPQADARTGVGTYPITVTPGSLDAVNYSFVGINSTVTIQKALLTVTANSAAMTYGAAPPALTYTVTGFVRGDYAINSITGTAAVTASAPTTAGAGSYAVTASTGTLSAANYNFAFVNATLTINKAVLSIRPASITTTYGNTLPTLTYTVAGLVNGDTSATAFTGAPALSTAATSQSRPGVFGITAAVGTLSSNNYVFTNETGSVTVQKQVLTVTPRSAAMIYGSRLPSFGYTFSGFANGDTASVIRGLPAFQTEATASSSVGSYPVTASVGTLQSSCYTFAGVSGTLTISKALLTVTAENQTAIYGQSLPVLSWGVTGFVNGDSAAEAISGLPALKTRATAGAPAESFAITAAMGTLTAENYSFVFVQGTLTIRQAALTISANDLTMNAGAAAPPLTYTVTGFVHGDTLASTGGGAPSLTTAATSRSKADSYRIDVARGTINAANYALTFVPGKLTVTQ